MILGNIDSLYDQYGKKLPGTLTPDDQHALKEGMDSIKDIENKEDARKFLELLTLLRTAEVKAIDGLGTSAMATIIGAFAGGDEGVYAADTDLMNARFIFELVQNVDDCKYENVDDCELRIQFNLELNTIKLEYNELGFRPENVIAITGLGNSTKNHKKARNIKAESKIDQSDLQEIGEKGIGFKSIFGLAKKVKITSQYFNFTIDKENFFVPIVDDYKNFTYSNHTVLELTLDEGMVEELYNFLKKKYDHIEAIINENPILFLNKLTEITYYKSEKDYFGFKVSRSDSTGEYSEEETTIEYFSSNEKKNRKIEAYRFIHNIEYSIEECKSRYGNQEESTRKHKIIIIAPKNPNMIQKGRIYSFFATAEEIYAPFIIHAPFKLNSGRTKIDSQSQGICSQNRWFLRTQKETVSMIKRAYEALAKLQGNLIRLYIPSISLVNSGCPLFCYELKKENILTWKIFEDVYGKHYPASYVCMIEYSTDLSGLIEIYSILVSNDILAGRKALLKIEYEEIKYFEKLGIYKKTNIEKDLLKCALLSERSTSNCLKYLKDFTPNFSIDDLYVPSLKLSYDQIVELSKYSKIVNWINKITFDYINKAYLGKGVPIYYTSYNGEGKSTEIIKNFCEEYGDAIDKKFNEYLKRSAYYETEFDNTIYLYDRIFGKNILEDFAEAYHKIVPNDKYFYPFLKIEAVSEDIDILCKKGENITDYEFLKRLNMHRKNQKNMLKNQYDSILKLIENSGVNSERFFPEILQNIDDCMYKNTPHATFKWIKLSEITKLTVEYNEVGFTREQIRAITAIGDSTKKSLLSAQATGEKGIGFKSIFALCNNVLIESGNFSFTLSDKTPTIPENIKEIEYRNGTKMEFTLKPREAQNVIRLLLDEAKIVQYSLCLKNLHSIWIGQNQIKILDKEDRRIVNYNKNKYEYFKYVHSVKMSYMALSQRKKNRNTLENQEIYYLYPLDKKPEKYYVYSTFPTQETILIPMIIDMPLELDTARERILEGEWNKEVISSMLNGLILVYEKLKYLLKENIYSCFPKNGRVIDHDKYGQSTILNQQIVDSKLFKLALNNEYISLKEGVFSHDFEYELLKEYSYSLGENLQSKLLYKTVENLKYLSQLFPNIVKKRSFCDICKSIDTLFTKMESNHVNIITNEKFRKGLYEFLESNNDYDEVSKNIIQKWKIVPVIYKKNTSYVLFSNDIYAPNEESIDSEKYKIIDKKIMSERTYNYIFSNITGNPQNISKFSKHIIIAAFYDEISSILENNMPEVIADKILTVYMSEKNLFQEMYKSRKDFKKDKLYLKNRKGKIIETNNCYLCNDPSSQGCLDDIIVESKYAELAKIIEIPYIDNISSYKEIPFEIGRKELSELNANKILKCKADLFSSLYLSNNMACDLKDNEGFFELYTVTPKKTRFSKEQEAKIVTISENAINLYTDEINEISTKDIPIEFKVDFETFAFEKDNILAEIEDELQIRKETEKINKIMKMLSNCFYAQISRREPCCIRSEVGDLLIIDSKITADYDIIEVLKTYFLDYFNTELSVNRNIHLYTRRGFENISTIDSNENDVITALSMIEEVNLNNIEEIKDFVCKPLSIHGITYGGYAKMCPLCGVRINTELTGMRIYKTKVNGMIVPLISCCNCHENLRYSSDININIDKLTQGVLDMHCLINGYEWSVSNKTIRLGHRALIRKINQRLAKDMK